MDWIELRYRSHPRLILAQLPFAGVNPNSFQLQQLGAINGAECAYDSQSFVDYSRKLHLDLILHSKRYVMGLRMEIEFSFQSHFNWDGNASTEQDGVLPLNKTSAHRSLESNVSWYRISV